jgi:hypothetical protein
VTTPAALDRQIRPRARSRAPVLAAVAAARVLSLLPPRRIRAVLGVARRGATPATAADAQAARDAVVGASLRCAGPRGCLPRSLATVLLCRIRGRWPVWCVGVRALPPFGAHAWVEADGRPVGEGLPENYFVALIRVPTRDTKR